MGFIINPYLFAAATDADADAFISAAGITDATQKSAIQTLVTDLKGYGIWTKMKAIYPFVGGTASTHKWNLKDPRDLDAAFRLTFNGGFTHSSTGVQGNGTNNYANTFFTGSNWNSIDDQSFGVYIRSDISGAAMCDIGGYGNTSDYFLYSRFTDGRFYIGFNSSLDFVTNSTSKGFYIGNKISSTLANAWKDGVKQTTTRTANSNTNQLTVSLYLSSYNGSGVAQFFSSKEYAFAFIGGTLTDTESSNFYTAVNAFNTTLSRNV